MKKILAWCAVAAWSLGCSSLYQRYDRVRFGENPYAEPPFYARYLNPDNALDRQIQQLLDVLRENPRNPAAHNELGSLLAVKGFSNDAEREFRRALAADPDFHPAWYNLALVQQAKGNYSGAVRALRRTVELKRGHAAAHFELGLLYEKRGQTGPALDHYVRAFRFNRALLDVRINPKILDSKLVDRALIELYPTEHARRSVMFQPTPADYIPPAVSSEPPPAPSEQAAPGEIVTPAPPVTEPSQQPAPPPPPPPPSP